MKLFRRCCFIFAALFFVACQVQPAPTITPTPNNPYADEAQKIISDIENAARGILRGSDNTYYRAVEYAARDALERFPDDSRAESWKWKMAYYSILAGDTKFGNSTYIDLIDTALNSGQATIESLPSWFHPGEQTEADGMIPFALKANKITTIGNDKKYLFSISSFPGNSCFLVVQSSNGYSTSLIYDGFPEGGFSIMRYDSLECSLQDLTNDGNDEVILELYRGGHVGFSSLRIMDISVSPMQFLPFAAPNGEKVFVEYGNIVKDFHPLNEKMQMQTVDYAPNCQVSLEKTFEWNGEKFTPLDIKFQADAKTYAPLKECLFWSISYAKQVDWDNGVKIIDQAIMQYEPVAIDDKDMQRLDEVRVNKALLYLFANHPSELRLTLQEVIDSPYQKNGIWVEPAKKFLEVYQDQTDIYRACSALTACDMYGAQAMGYSSCNYQSPCSQDAIEYLVSHQFKDLSLSKLIENLQTAGVKVLSSGWVDFDFDGTDELWFTVVPPDKTEMYPTNQLWIASGYPNEIKLFSAGAGIKGETPYFQMEMTSNGEVFVRYSEIGTFLWSRDSITKEPKFHGTAIPVQSFYSEEMNLAEIITLRQQLQSEIDPYKLYIEYMKLKKRFDTNPSLDCITCYFDVGYVAELVGDKKTAVEMYSEVVERFPEHPLAILAKSKLARVK